MLLIVAFATLLVHPSLVCSQAAINNQNGIVYCRNGDADLSMDVAYPKDPRGQLPAIVYVSGSGWGHWWGKSCDRHQFAWAIKLAASKGYFAATVDYRPTCIRNNGKVKFPFPAQLVDVRRAVRWLRAHHDQYKIDPRKIAAVGWSSGGHIALLLGLLGNQARLYGETGDESQSSAVQAVVSIAGPTDLELLYRDSTFPGISDAVEELLGGKPEQNTSLYRNASPISFVTKEAPPILLIHGLLDNEVPPNQSTLFYAMMKQAGAPIQLVTLKTTAHENVADNAAVFPFLENSLK